MNLDKIRAALDGAADYDAALVPFPLSHSGKVRDLYDLGDRFLILASDRISAFDVILPEGIPGKGILLTQLSLWWFAQVSPVIANHLVEDHAKAVADLLADQPSLVPRAMLVRKLEPLKIEAVVRGYLSGSGWKQYRESGNLWEHSLPSGLLESAQLPEPLFTPTTKASVGDKDVPMAEAEGRALLGDAVHARIREVSLELYRQGAERAKRAGLILADTKFEFGMDEQGELVLIDEILTPDSSRYWPADAYETGRPQASFDKQFVRDYLETLDWDKSPPGPRLPAEVVDQTQLKYLQALEALMCNE